MKKKSRGSILVQVLIMSLLMAILATGLIRMIMNQYVVAVDAQRNTLSRQQIEAVVAAIQSAWTVNMSMCSSWGPVSCTNPGTCSCTCTVTGYPIPGTNTTVTATAFLVGGLCTIRVAGAY